MYFLEADPQLLIIQSIKFFKLWRDLGLDIPHLKAYKNMV